MIVLLEPMVLRRLSAVVLMTSSFSAIVRAKEVHGGTRGTQELLGTFKKNGDPMGTNRDSIRICRDSCRRWGEKQNYKTKV